MFRPLLLSLTILLCTAGCLSETDEPYDTEAALAITTAKDYYDSINYMNCLKGPDGKTPKKCDGTPGCTCDKRCDCCLKPAATATPWCKQPAANDVLYRVVHLPCDAVTKECPAAPAATGGWYTDKAITCANYPDLCTWEGNDADKKDCIYVFKLKVEKGTDGKLNCKSPCDGPVNAGSPGECGGQTCKSLNTFLCGPGTLESSLPCGDCKKKMLPGGAKPMGKKTAGTMLSGDTCVACRIGDPGCEGDCCVVTADQSAARVATCTVGGGGVCGECDPTVDPDCEPCGGETCGCDPATDPGCSADAAACGCTACPYEPSDPRYDSECVDADACPYEREPG
jgi:hypothetical protein